MFVDELVKRLLRPLFNVCSMFVEELVKPLRRTCSRYVKRNLFKVC